jgi:hypothetical protein
LRAPAYRRTAAVSLRPPGRLLEWEELALAWIEPQVGLGLPTPSLSATASAGPVSEEGGSSGLARRSRSLSRWLQAAGGGDGGGGGIPAPAATMMLSLAPFLAATEPPADGAPRPTPLASTGSLLCFNLLALCVGSTEEPRALARAARLAAAARC